MTRRSRGSRSHFTQSHGPSSHWPGCLSLVADEFRILLKRSLEKKIRDLVWIDLLRSRPRYPAHDVPVSHRNPFSNPARLSFREFSPSLPDGPLLAVVITGKTQSLVFPLPR